LGDVESSWCGHPGSAFGKCDEGLEEVDAVFGCGCQVASDRAELLGAGEGAQAAGDFLSDFGHPDVAFRGVVERGLVGRG
jgi:hypothetical protein